ncbi:MAG: signal peptidase I [Acidimicrobiales bacterium]
MDEVENDIDTRPGPARGRGGRAPVVHFDRVIGRPEVLAVAEHGHRRHRVDLWRVAITGAATFILGICIGLAALSTSPILIGYTPVSLVSGSMEPVLHAGDVVLTKPDVEVNVGSIINYRTNSGNRIHRVVEVVDAGYRTRGDSNQSPDRQIVAAADIRGTGVFVIPFVGLPRLWYEQGRWLNLALATAALGLCGRLAAQGPMSGPEAVA